MIEGRGTGVEPLPEEPTPVDAAGRNRRASIVGVALVLVGAIVVAMGVVIGFWTASMWWIPGEPDAVRSPCGSVWYVHAYHHDCRSVLDHRTRLVFWFLPVGAALVLMGAATLALRRVPGVVWWFVAGVLCVVAALVGVSEWTTRVLETFMY